MAEISVVGRLAAVNPVPETSEDDLEIETVLSDVWRRIASTGSRKASSPRSHRNLTIVVCVAAVALSVPALGVSGVLGDLFSFSAKGTTPTQPLSEDSLSALERMTGNADSLQLIAKRDGEAFYTARTQTGDLCVGVGKPDQAAPSFTQLRCTGTGGDSFPSRAVPVILASPLFGNTSSDDVYLKQIYGFAADAIARIVVKGPGGEVRNVPTSDNLFSADMPHQPVSELDALDSSGSVVWSLPLKRP